MGAEMMRRERLAQWIDCHPLGLALALGFVLRLISIESRSVSYDDTFSIFLSARPLPQIITGTAADTMPPLYYFLLHFWMMMNQSVWFIRLLSVLLSLAAITLLFWLVQYWFGRPAAGWAAVLAAVSPLLIYHGQDVRMYALLVVCQLSYLLFFTRIWFAWKQSEGQTARTYGGWVNWIGLVLSGAAAMYSHNVAIFALVVPNVYLLLRREWKLLLRLIAAQALIGLLGLPWLLMVPGQVAKVQRAWWLSRPGLIHVIQAVIMMVASLPLPFPLMALVLLLSLQILAMLILALWRNRRQNPDTGLLLALLIVPPTLLFIVSYIVKPVFVSRTFLVSSLAYDALAGLVIVSTWKNHIGKLIAGAFLLAAAVSLPFHYTHNTHPRSPYLPAVEYLAAQPLAETVIVHETKLSYFPAHFYAPDLPQTFLADPPGSANDNLALGSQQAMQIFPVADLEFAVSESRSVYFITFSQTFREYEEMGLPEHPNIRWLEDHFRRADRQVFSDLEIFHYVR